MSDSAAPHDTAALVGRISQLSGRLLDRLTWLEQRVDELEVANEQLTTNVTALEADNHTLTQEAARLRQRREGLAERESEALRRLRSAIEHCLNELPPSPATADDESITRD